MSPYIYRPEGCVMNKGVNTSTVPATVNHKQHAELKSRQPVYQTQNFQHTATAPVTLNPAAMNYYTQPVFPNQTTMRFQTPQHADTAPITLNPTGMNCYTQPVFPNQTPQTFQTPQNAGFVPATLNSPTTGMNHYSTQSGFSNQNTQHFQPQPLPGDNSIVALQNHRTIGNFQQGTQPCSPLQILQSNNRPMCAPCYPNMENTTVIPNSVNPFAENAQTYPTFNAGLGSNVHSPPAYHVHPASNALPYWPSQSGLPYARDRSNFHQPIASSFLLPHESPLHTRFIPNGSSLQNTSHPLPTPLGKLLFPTIFDFTHDSFFKMLVHTSGFDAKNISFTANKQSLEIHAAKDELEKGINHFAGCVLKQVTRVYHFPEPVEESKIQISVSEDVISILIPWRQKVA